MLTRRETRPPAASPRPSRAFAATRRLLAASGAVLVLVPFLAPAAEADGSNPVKQMANDLADARRDAKGEGVRIAVLSDGVDDVLGKHVEKEKDYVGLPSPKREYGTLLSSLVIGGTGNLWDVAEMRLYGMAHEAKVLPIRVYPSNKERGGKTWDWYKGPVRNTAQGIRYAADKGAQVIVVTGTEISDEAATVRASIAYAQAKDSLVVTATGAREASNPSALLATPGVLGVGVVDEDGDRYKKYSTASNGVLVAAYGDKMFGIGPDGQAGWTFWGEGPALAMVGSTAALVRSRFPKLTSAQVVQAITSSARNPKKHYTTDLGFGYVNASGALEKAATLAKRPAPPTTAEPVIADTAHFVAKPPGRVRAVPITLPWFGGFGALIAVGVIAIAAAVWLLIRRRPASPVEPALPLAEDATP